MLGQIFNLLLCTTEAFAVPVQMNHQGRLLDSEGNGLTNSNELTFRIMDAAENGSELWTETQTVGFINGYYAVLLGSDENNPLDDALFALEPLFLELTVNGEAMSPRYSMASVPYAQIAAVAERVEGGTVDASEISIGGVTVIDANGHWSGPTPDVDYSDLTGVPSDLADGDDDTRLSESEVEDYVTNGALDLAAGTQLAGSTILTTADTLSPEWTNLQNRPPGLDDGDNDSLMSLGCAQGETVGWDGSSWVCVSDATLSDSDVMDIVQNNAVDLDALTTLAGQQILTDGDESLSGLSCLDGEIPRWDGIAGNWYCAGDGMNSLNCGHGEIASYDSTIGTWVCSSLQSLTDNDGDGVVSWQDCDDSDPNLPAILNDADCDGYDTTTDCDDTDPDSHPGAVEDLTDGVDNDCDGAIDENIPYVTCGNHYVSVDTFQGDFNANGGFCTAMLGQQAYILRTNAPLGNCSFPDGTWQGNGNQSFTWGNCSLYTSADPSHEGHGEGGYGSCAQYRQVVCSTNPSDCMSNDCENWD